ncbi:TonB-dependent receptor [Chryseolinea sp. T2]|uniref:SusC/RagA family TonB-linked outer membrane protein n=1 Tax=Chryseolinea sp. T2 TaxID=3129255 RepID=UPI0030784310
MKKLYGSLSLTLAVLLMLASVAVAQDRTVTGTVSDETGAGMPGVNVLVKGTTNGTVTDVEGKYSLSAPSNATLVITFVGYKTTEIAAGDRTKIDVALEVDLTSLDEVVVTGYGIDKRREIAGAVSIVKTKDLTVTPTGNVEQLLQGRVPGVTVIQNGQPGSTAQIRIRGFGSIGPAGSNNPLYIVDGVPTQDVGFINPDDIETTTVLKDAAAASIYGARAASGVVVYTTKKGKKGQKLQVTYDGMFGFTTPGKGTSMMNPTDFADWTWKAQYNTEDANAAADGRPVDYAKALSKFAHPQFGGGLSPVIPDYLMVGGSSGVTGTVDLEAERLKYNVDPRKGAAYQVIAANKQGTDWYDELTSTAPLSRSTIGINGGGEASRFYIGLSAQNQDGTMINQKFERYAFRANSEFDILPNLRIGENMQFTYRSIIGLQGEDGGAGISDDENDYLAAFRMPSIIPVYDVFGGYAGTAAKGFNNPRNPVANRDGLDNNKQFNAFGFGNVYLELDVIPGLTLRTSIGGNYVDGFSKGFTRWQYENSENNSAFGFNQAQGYRFSWTFTNTATYKKAFGDHNVEVLLGQEALNTGKGWDYSQQGNNPFSWDPNFVNMTQVTATPPNSSQSLGVNFSSLFGQVKYTFKEKYIIGGVLRRDGSSRFGENNRYGVFPAASAAWRISAEPFMQNVRWITDLKIRGGYGTMGNSNPVNPNNQYTLYGGDMGASSYDVKGSNSSATVGYYRTRIGNADAKWETAVTSNLGFDALFFDGKLDVTFDLWRKDTRDLLLQVPITAVVGYRAAAPSVNVAEMRNQGIDLGITTKGNINTKLSYEVNVNGSFLQNELTGLPTGQTYIGTINPGYRGINPIRNGLGHSISSFFGYKVEGLWESNEEVKSYNAIDGDATSEYQAGAAAGRFKYKDINGDGKINSDDRTFIGSPVPKFTGGFNFTIRYGNFDFYAYLYTSLGNKIFNQSKWFTDFYPSFQGAGIAERVKDSWTPENTGASIPIFESASNFSTNTQSSSFYVEDGSYLRLQNITLGYNLPSALLNKWKMTKLRLFVSANNVATITGYSGLDPSVGGNVDTQYGIDLGNAPLNSSFTGGINLGF